MPRKPSQIKADSTYESKRINLVNARVPQSERSRVIEIRDALKMTERDLINAAIEYYYQSRLIV